MRYDRNKILFGDNFKKLINANIIILGVGGVGGYALDCLYRSGVQNITIVDYDYFEETNRNRQIGSDAIGENKVEQLKKLYPNINTINTKIDTKWVKEFDMSNFDLILDAIDDIIPKIQIIEKYYKKLITTTGSAKRIDPTKIKYISIFETFNDPFAKRIRKELNKINFDKDIKVIFSSEFPQCSKTGSFVGVTGSFGLFMCSIAVEFIIKN